MLQTSSATPQPIPPVGAPVAERRIDGPHPVNRPPELEPLDPIPATIASQQLEHQAEQLAGYLREQQRGLDHREAQLHARIAQWEHEQRVGRLRLEERGRELDEREALLAKRESELSARSAELGQAQTQVQQTCEAVERRAKQLAAWEQRLQQQQQSLRTAEQQLVATQQKWQQQMTCEHQQLQARRAELFQFRRHMLQNLDYHRAALDEREKSPPPQPLAAATLLTEPEPPKLPGAATDLRRRWRAFEQEREMWCALRDQQRRELDEWAAKERAQLKARKERINQQRQQLQHMYRWLINARQDALRLHGQMLEMRLAAEQAWANAQTAADPNQLERNVAQLRGELADYYAAQRSEADQLLLKTEQAAQKLDERQQRFESERKEWQTWLAQQREKIKTKSAQLIARQQQLDEQQARLRWLEADLVLRK